MAQLNQEQLRELEACFHEKIPMTQAMGIRVEASDPGAFVISAPLSLNYNHLGTAFGGSLSAIATVAGYGYLWQTLADNRCHVVIRDSSIKYRKPVRGDIRATCHRPEESVVLEFKAKFARVGRGSVALEVTIEADDGIAVDFHGTYVAFR